MNEDIISRLKASKLECKDSDLINLLQECISKFENRIEVYCGQCGEIFYTPDCPCYTGANGAVKDVQMVSQAQESDHPLLKQFLKTD